MSKFNLKHVVAIVLMLICFEHVSSTVLELDQRFPIASKDGMWLVMFYAPWCGHCRKLEPTWVSVGQKLSKTRPNVKVGRLDATRHTKLASLYKINGFPTIKFIKEGRPIDYNGPRTEASIMSFVDRAQRPPVTEMQVTASYEQAKEANDVFFLYVGPDNTPVKDNFAKAAKALFTRLSFYSIEHYKLPATIVTRQDTTVLVVKDGKYYEIPEPLLETSLISWILAEQLPTYNHLTSSSIHLLRTAGKPFAITVIPKNHPFNVTMQGVAYKRSHPYTFCWSEGNEFVNSITYGSIPVPNLVIFDENTKEYHVMRDVEQALTKANVEGFFGKVVDGKHPVRGGNGWLEMTKRAFLSIIYFFYDLFANTPVLGFVVVFVPTFIIGACCLCICSLKDDEASSEFGDDSDFDDEEWESRGGDIETLGSEGLDNQEGLRKRMRDTNE